MRRQRHHLRRRVEAVRPVQDVAHGRRAKAVDRLRVVADHRDTAPVRLQPRQDVGLQGVGVLVFVDQHMVEPVAQSVRHRLDLQRLGPVEQDVVVVEDALRLLGGDIAGEQPAQVVGPFGTPGELAVQHRLQVAGQPGIDGVAVDREAGALAREAAAGRAQAQIVAHEVQQVFRIAPVEHREIRRQADPVSLQPEQPGTHRVERSGPVDPRCGAAWRRPPPPGTAPRSGVSSRPRRGG